MGNAVAHLILLLWLPLSLVVASVLPPLRAFLAIAIGGALLLPERVAFDFPLVPPLDKHAIAMLSAWVALLLVKPQSLKGPRASKASLYVALAVAANCILTVVTNRDALRYGPVALPGLTAHDILSGMINELLRVALPFYLGQALIRTTDDLREFLRALVFAALCYTPLIFLEVRFSPILHEKIYGFFQHDFEQAMRNGGFRAFVFMSHGLAVAFFVSQAVTAAFGLNRMERREPPGTLPMALLLCVTLATCKSMGAFIYAFLSVPLILYTTPKTQARLAGWLSLIVLLYPVARMYDIISTEWILQQANSLSEDRARSLEFRFNNELMLLHKAQERPYFGWGGWSRSFVFDPETGRDLSVVDGEWILQFGARGTFGFALTFGSLLYPVFRAKKALAALPPLSDEARCIAMTAVLLAFTGLDLLPNSISHKIPYLMAGALTSVCATVLKYGYANQLAGQPGSSDRNRAFAPPLRLG